MATAAGVAACNNKKRVKFYRTAALVNDLLDAKAAGTIKPLLKKLEKADLLICDEWGNGDISLLQKKAPSCCFRSYPSAMKGGV
jgi:DNA replication protein DnaC